MKSRVPSINHDPVEIARALGWGIGGFFRKPSGEACAASSARRKVSTAISALETGCRAPFPTLWGVICGVQPSPGQCAMAMALALRMMDLRRGRSSTVGGHLHENLRLILN
jgi:hypothetical protein